jgi:ribonuclease VapC
MVIDTSALVAILFGESDAKLFAEALSAAPVRLVSAVTRVELAFVVEGRKGAAGGADLELLLRDGGFDIVSVTPQQADIALDAFPSLRPRASPRRSQHRRLLLLCVGRGEQPSALFKGDDFAYTDLRPALPAAGSPG